jgi:hypothetical protein
MKITDKNVKILREQNNGVFERKWLRGNKVSIS